MTNSHNGYTFDFPNSKAFIHDHQWFQLYESLFSVDHRETRSVIQRSVRHGTGMALRVQHEGKTIGMATGHLLKDPAAVFMVYLGAHPAHRHHHLGRQMMDALYEEGKNRLAAMGRISAGMIWEVEDPMIAHSAGERQGREKLISYFCQQGGHVLNSKYIQPPVDGVKHTPKKLMFRPAGPGALPHHQAIQALVHAMYFEKYGAENGIAQHKLTQLLAA